MKKVKPGELPFDPGYVEFPEITIPRMKYTKEKPTKPGWYWIKDNGGEAIVEVLKHDGYLWFEYRGDEYPLDGDNEWAGPIEKPE